MLLAVIAACEIGFWVLLAAGLATRYLLRLPKAGMVLLAGVPLVDIVMLVAGVVDIQRGGEPSFEHSLAAIFIGVSVGWYRHLLAYCVGVGVMAGLGVLSGQGYDAVLGPAWPWTIVLVTDAIVSFSYSVDGDDAGQTREKQSV